MALYELTKAADEDFEKLFEFGIDAFGFTQALNYQQGMNKQFEALASQPDRQYVIDKIRRGLKRAAIEGKLDQASVEQKLRRWLPD